MTKIQSREIINSDHPLPTKEQPYASFSDINTTTNHVFFSTQLDFQVPPDHEITKPKTSKVYSCLQDVLDEEAISQIGARIGHDKAKEVWDKAPVWDKPRVGNSSKHEMRFNIAPAAMNRDDLRAKVTLRDQEFVTHHDFCHNSPLNGKQYYNSQREIVTIDRAFSPSQDRFGTGIQMLRRVGIAKDDHTEALLYTGRPDTPERALEQATWLFLQELNSGTDKGISHDDATNTTTFTYVVQSLLSPGPHQQALQKLSHKIRDESAVVENEVASLKWLKDQGEREITDPRDGSTRKVRFNPIFLDSVLNHANELMEAAGDTSLFGKTQQKELSEEGLQALRAYANEKPEIPELREALAFCEGFHSYTPENKVLAIYRLCRALELPHVIHCMSSKDRTGICIALISAVRQYEELHGAINYETIFEQNDFKELFAANLMVGHTVARYGRGAQGEFMGEELEELFGLDMKLNQSLYRLLPSRYIKKESLAKRIVLALVGMLAFMIPILSTLVNPFLGVRLALSMKYKLNNKCPLIQDRHLAKQKESHPFAQSLQLLLNQLENKNSPSEDLNQLTQKIQHQRTAFIDLLSNGFLTPRLSPETLRFLRAACHQDTLQSIEAGVSSLQLLRDPFVDLEKLTKRMQKQDLSPDFARSLSPREKELILVVLRHQREIRSSSLFTCPRPEEREFLEAALNWKFYEYTTTDNEDLIHQITNFWVAGGVWGKEFIDIGNEDLITQTASTYLDDKVTLNIEKRNHQIIVDQQRKTRLRMPNGELLFQNSQEAHSLSKEDGLNKINELQQQLVTQGLSLERASLVLCAAHQASGAACFELAFLSLKNNPFNQVVTSIKSDEEEVFPQISFSKSPEGLILTFSQTQGLFPHLESPTPSHKVKMKGSINCLTGKCYISFELAPYSN